MSPCRWLAVVADYASPVLRTAVAAAIFALALCGCDQRGPDPDDPILNREDAVRYAPDIHDIALRQGVDVKAAPCIWDDPTGEWVIVVDAKGGRPLEEVARACPSYVSGESQQAVILTLDGEIAKAR
jgi:hypothetical protein